MKEFNVEKFETFIAQFPIFEYRIITPDEVVINDRVRHICEIECERYGSTWACPPAVGTVEECTNKIHGYKQAVFFSSVAEVSDVLNLEETLETRRAHEDITNELGKYLESEGYETFILSTESCDICSECAYIKGEPCRYPEKMHPCLESHGVIVTEIVEAKEMTFYLGGNAILWFSMILIR